MKLTKEIAVEAAEIVRRKQALDDEVRGFMERHKKLVEKIRAESRWDFGPLSFVRKILMQAVKEGLFFK